MYNYKEHRKPRGWWTLEHCKEEALKYSTAIELRKKERGCHHTILDNHWEDICFSHMKRSKQRVHAFDKQNLADIAAKFSTHQEFKKKDNAAYRAAVRLGCLDEICSHMPEYKKFVPATEEELMAIASKYASRSDFAKNELYAYNRARTLRCLDKICAHMESSYCRNKRCVYVAKFEDNCIYVGITCRHKERWLHHLQTPSSAVYRHSKKDRIATCF